LWATPLHATSGGVLFPVHAFAADKTCTWIGALIEPGVRGLVQAVSRHNVSKALPVY
jgi:hypothetical protein